jgi:hypothetical protein
MTGEEVVDAIAVLAAGDLEKRRAAGAKLAAAEAEDKVIEALILALGATQDNPGGGGDVPPLPIGAAPQGLGDKHVMLTPCCESLLALGSKATPNLIAALQNSSRWVRYGAAWVLGRSKDAERRNEVLAALRGALGRQDEDCNVLEQAVKSLGICHDAQAVPVVDHWISTGKNTGRTIWRCLDFLAAEDPAVAARHCVNFARGEQPERLQEIALSVAGKLNDEATLDLLLKALEMKNLVTAACGALRERRPPNAVSALLRANAAPDADTNSKVETAWALAVLGNDKGVEMLHEMTAPTADKKTSGLATYALERFENAKPKLEVPHDKFVMGFVDLGGGLMVPND